MIDNPVLASLVWRVTFSDEVEQGTIVSVPANGHIGVRFPDGVSNVAREDLHPSESAALAGAIKSCLGVQELLNRQMQRHLTRLAAIAASQEQSPLK